MILRTVEEVLWPLNGGSDAIAYAAYSEVRAQARHTRVLIRRYFPGTLPSRGWLYNTYAVNSTFFELRERQQLTTIIAERAEKKFKAHAVDTVSA